MAYRVVTLGNGDTVRVSESVLKGAGPRGLPGPPGPAGEATTIKGRYDSYDDLIANVPLGLQGEAYIADDTGHLWAWDTEVEEGEGIWRDCGRIVGPAAATSIGALRTGIASVDLLGGKEWVAVYTQLVYNDPDPLSGNVLREASLTPTVTVFDAENMSHYLAITEIEVAAGVNAPSIDVAWKNATGSTSGAETFAPQRGDRWRITHVAVLRADSTVQWSLSLTPSINTGITEIATTFTRVGGGVGPQGVPGPYPQLAVSAPQKLPHDAPMTASFTQTGVGSYTLNLGLAQGVPGEAQSGFSSMDAIAGAGADSSSQPEGYEPVYVTDQAIPVPGRTAKPHVPYFFDQLAQKLHRLVVARLTTSERTTRGTPIPGELVYDTNTKQFLGGDAAGAWKIVPTVEYGTDAAIVHNAPTTRPNGSLYFKHEA